MSVIPQGKAVQAMYRDYREGNLLVNRKYQRKLVWTLEEKKALIDSIMKGYPIPLIILAERPDFHGTGRYEIIDGIQRLNAIFGFIEMSLDLKGQYFDLSQFATANQYASEGAFTPRTDVPLLPPKDCARVLDYQLAITIYPAREEGTITDVFGRINSGGRQLSAQEQRQAGVTTQFSQLVRSIASELRGDVSQDVLLLSQMPEISIESGRVPHGYGIKAEETIWCRQGILSVKQLRESEDEQLIADTAASIVRGEPLPVSKELLDRLYDPETDESSDLEKQVIAYGIERLSREIKFTFSAIKQVIEDCNLEANFLRSTVRPGTGYPIKAPLYAIFMAFFDLIVKEQKSPCDSKGIITALKGLDRRIETGGHYETTANRVHNINMTKGLIQSHFATRVPPAFGHGPTLLLDFENALRRSRIETSRYEFKQGILRLDSSRPLDTDLLDRLVESTCGIANLGPEMDGNIFLGVADKTKDSDRIAKMDGITPYKVAHHYVVGVDREAKILRLSLDQYLQRIVGAFQKAELTEPLKSQVLTGFDPITVQGLTVIRIFIPPQKTLSFVGEKCFVREGNSTVEVSGQKLLAISKKFPS